MANTKKMTKRDYFNALYIHFQETGRDCGTISADSMMNFIEHELELLEKNNSSEKKPTAQQTANEGIKTAILEGMKPNRLYTITEIQKEIPECAELSNQRVSALIRQMVGNEIVRTEDKRKAYFSLAE